MPFTPLLCVLALLPLQAGAFQENRIEHITVVEGQSLDLHCVVAGDSQSALEWKSPSGFLIFFNTWQGLRDPRYKLIHFSEDGLSIRLTNVTKHDKGLYSCFHYSEPIKVKQVNVTILDVPFKTLLEVSRIRVPNKEEKVILTCSTWGHRPRPRITWLLDNGVEVFGMSQIASKNCNSTSVLTVQRYSPNSAISCVIRHRVLRGGNVTLTLHLKDIRINLTYEGTVMKKPNILLPVLVTALLFALLIIVLLFMVKLWKAHRDWRKENDVSEQTLESNRSRPNEDQHGQEKNGHEKKISIHNICLFYPVVTWKTSKKYVIQRSCMRTSKDSEESQDSSVFEKQLPYVKETDL
ncbi:cytotoxic and regulatory T-cell molecule [Elgaria multicarinata webbii]|uniref:cytotoxic and regulatory T-cell molecule n=1 Tax=Elgaria multicarinata webbii TaxID=159646 RepID=UPI002FCD3461